jgi:hypothetical protein
MSRLSIFVAVTLIVSLIAFVAALNRTYADCASVGCAQVIAQGVAGDYPVCYGYEAAQCILNIWSDNVIPGTVQCISYDPIQTTKQRSCNCNTACYPPQPTDVREATYQTWANNCNSSTEVTVQRLQCSPPG